MRRIIFYCLLMSVILHFPAFAQTFTMDDFLARVRESHPFFKKEALLSDIERKEQEKFLGDEDWVVRASPFYSHEESAWAGSFFPKEVDQTGINAALERTYWRTGGRLSFSYDYAKTDQGLDDVVIPFNGLSAVIPGDSGIFHENSLAVTYTHPLLRNRKGVLSRLAYDLQGYNIEAADLSVVENQENFLLDTGDRFLDWVLLTERRRILKVRYQLALEELQRTIKKRKQNLVDEVDVIRARDAVLNAEQKVLRTEADWKGTKQELAVVAQFQTGYDFMPEYDIYSFVELPEEADAIVKLRQKSRVLNVFKILIRQLEHKKKGALEQSKPQLDFNVSGGLKSSDGNLEDSYGMDKPQLLASLNFSYPLGNRTARADILKAGLEKDRVREDMKNMSLELESRLRNILTRLKELEKVLEVNKKQVVVAKEKTNAELHRYEQGRIELTFVIQSRDHEQNVQLIHAQNGVVYHKLVLRYLALTDKLF